MKISHQDKKDLLIEALSYIQRFRNQIIVIKYGGAAMIEEALRTSFAQDIVLLQSLGCLLYTSPSPRDLSTSRMPSSA
mgnify:CR=1 FL=1